MGENRSLQRIFVSLPSATFVQRRRFEGVLSFAHDRVRSGWQLRFFSDFNRRTLATADGIIAFLETPDERLRYLRLGKPTVFVQADFEPGTRPPRHAGTATVVVDSDSEGRTAAKYYLERGYRAFAYVGSPEPTVWSANRERSFVHALAAAGFDCAIHPRDSALAHWMAHLPRQTAIFCANDRRAREVIACATDLGRDVPHDLAVLGVDDDTLLCETVTPALSSIPTSAFEDGTDAAAALEALLTGRPAPSVIRKTHERVVSRFSTAADASDDPFLSRALEAIRADLAGHHTSATLAASAGCSEKTLVNRALARLGRSLAAEIRRLRLAAAEDLLADTDLPVAQIAEDCGFFDASHLALRLREVRGLTPNEIRRGTRDCHLSGTNSPSRHST